MRQRQYEARTVDHKTMQCEKTLVTEEGESRAKRQRENTKGKKMKTPDRERQGSRKEVEKPQTEFVRRR